MVSFSGAKKATKILAVGPAGVGKSLFLNVLAGKNYFNSGPAVTGGLTKNVEICDTALFGKDRDYKLQLIDTPGFGDPDILPEDIVD